MLITRTILILSMFLISLFDANAATKSVKVKAPSGTRLLILADSDGSAARSTSAGSATVEITDGNKGRVYLTSATTGALAANVILAIKKGSKYYTWNQAKTQKLCKGNARAVYGFTVKGAKLNLGNIKSKSGFAYITTALKPSTLTKTEVGTINTRCEPTASAATLGYGGSSAQRIKAQKNIRINGDSVDSDSDGLANALDADDDDDGVIDSYDPDTTFTNPPSGQLPSKVKLFSNSKPTIDSSLNAYTETITDDRINTLVSHSNLAIQVAGGNLLATELDCGALTYCSSGGTGTANNQPFPANFDGDADGKGTITPGGTGDFQLTTNASKTTIGGGDVLIEEVDNGDGTTTTIPAMLSFIFNTTPAIASITMDSTTLTPVYPATNGMVGSANNPFTAPGGWDQKLVITAYRPQREGISAAGEGALVDIGNSNISIDIPNTACVGSGGCSGMNSSRCQGSAYTETDANLSLSGDKLKDSRADQDTDTANPTANQITFTVDLSTCISESWDSGEKLAIDLQFSNDVGDNAAQKFYIQLP